jgi:hypothetical protein
LDREAMLAAFVALSDVDPLDWAGIGMTLSWADRERQAPRPLAGGVR